MKFTPEVVAALKVLRDNAESDFERHRLDVLERDLTAPPTVEIVDEKHQKFLDVTYYKTKNGHYATLSFIHRVVFTYYCGEIPDDYHVHHIDTNKSNNNAENLQRLPAAQHHKIHATNCVAQQFVCEYCGQEFSRKQICSENIRFCSRKCYKAWVRREKPVKKICAFCGKEFNTYDAKIKYCSQSCASQASNAKRKKDRTKTCEFCGQKFVANKSRQRFCSKSCAMKHRNRKD